MIKAFSKVDSDMRALSGLLAEVLKSAMHDLQAAARASVSICLVLSGLSHFVATSTVGRDEVTNAAKHLSLAPLCLHFV